MLLLIITFVTLLITYLIFANSITYWFKPKIPIKFGFKINNQILNKLEVQSGDPNKRIILHFKNKESITLSNIVIDIKFHRPLSLSGSNTAITIIPDHTSKNRSEKYYNLTYYDIPFYPEDTRDFPTEIDTDRKLGKYKISVLLYSINDKYKKKKKDLILSIK